MARTAIYRAASPSRTFSLTVFSSEKMMNEDKIENSKINSKINEEYAARVAFAKGRLAAVVITQLWLWFAFLRSRTAWDTGSLGPILLVISSLAGVYWVIRAAWNREPVWLTSTLLLCIFSGIVLSFANMYWHYGTGQNFSITLSRLDAIYFALGTLTTAGTGAIYAKSQVVIGIVSWQIVIDLLFVSGAIALGVTRLAESGKSDSKNQI